MSTELTIQTKSTTELSNQNEYTTEQIDLIKNQICKNATDNELKLFMYNCKRSGLDPFVRQIYAIKRREWDRDSSGYIEKMSIQTAIDGFRLIADRTNRYEGQTDTLWCGRDGIWKDVWLSSEYPMAAKVGVYKSGCKAPFVGIARWDSYAQKNKDGKVGPMWAKMPDHMLAKCAESLALRKAFPQELSGLYTSDEMSGSDQIPEKKTPKPAETLQAQPIPIQSLPMPQQVAPERTQAIRSILAVRDELMLSDDQLKAEIHKEFGIESLKAMTLEQLQKFDSTLQAALEASKIGSTIDSELSTEPTFANFQ